MRPTHQPTPLDALQAASRPNAAGGAAPLPRLVVAGGAGVLGTELLTRLVASQRYCHTEVLVREPFTMGLRHVGTTVLPEPGQPGEPHPWPDLQADVAVVVFDTPRLYHDRERALWMPQPADLLPLATWLRTLGVHTLAVVLPHAQGRLPEAVKRGLANLDEQAVAALGFERVLLVRTARKPAAPDGQRNLFERVAGGMLSVFGYMVPQSEQPVRASRVAAFVLSALQQSPPGIHIAAPETVWRALQGDVDQTVRDWVKPGGCSAAPATFAAQ